MLTDAEKSLRDLKSKWRKLSHKKLVDQLTQYHEAAANNRDELRRSAVMINELRRTLEQTKLDHQKERGHRELIMKSDLVKASSSMIDSLARMIGGGF